MDNCKQNDACVPRTAMIPDAVSSVLHWTEAVGERLEELSRRLSPVLRNEPLPNDAPASPRPSTNVALANDINVAAGRANAAAEVIDDLMRRLEL